MHHLRSRFSVLWPLQGTVARPCINAQPGPLSAPKAQKDSTLRIKVKAPFGLLLGLFSKCKCGRRRAGASAVTRVGGGRGSGQRGRLRLEHREAWPLQASGATEAASQPAPPPPRAPRPCRRLRGSRPGPPWSPPQGAGEVTMTQPACPLAACSSLSNLLNISHQNRPKNKG